MGLFSGRPVTDRAGGGRRLARTTYFGISGPQDLIPPRPFLRPNWPVVTNDTALRHSAVWACLRTRADIVSTLPLDVYRRVAGVQVEMGKPPVLTDPGGDGMGWEDWAWATQFDLDRAGNTVGLITATSGYGLPAAIELQDINSVTIKVRDGRISKYKIGGTEYDPAVVWHERQYRPPGMHAGLSPIAYARWAIGEYLTVQEFATDWFGAGAVPKARLKNTAKVLNPAEIATVKEAWRAALASDEPFVHGSDWDYSMLQAQQASADWLEAKRFSITDVCRFFGVPSDIVDSAPTGETRPYTYANISQKHLAFLLIQLGPALARREAKFTARLVPAAQYVKLNGDALLRLDPISRADVLKTQIDARVLAPSEARELEDRPPFTDAQLAEFDRLFGPPQTGTGAFPDGAAVPPENPGQVPDGELVPAGASTALAARAVPRLGEFTGSPFTAASPNGRH